MTAGAVSTPSPTLSPLRKVAFAVVAVVVVVVAMLAALLAVDVYLHHRVEGVSGLNVWGYRGPSAGRKAPGERRVVALGGSTVFGYGLPWNESWPYFVERRLAASRARSQGGPITVVNLGAPRDSVATFVVTLDDYAYLDYDFVIFYEGYNDLDASAGAGASGGVDPALGHYVAWRHQSPVFRWTGYLPILPLVLSEKAMAMMHGGDVNAAYAPGEIVFRPGLGTRITAGALKATADITLGLEQRFGRLTPGGPGASEAFDTSCERWSRYCGAVADAVRLARQRGKGVLVVTQPYLSDLHVEQQRALEASVRRQFGGDPRVRYVNLGGLINLHDPQLAYDGLHLTAAGNDKVAAALAPAVQEMLQ